MSAWQISGCLLLFSSLFPHIQQSLGCCLHPTLRLFPKAHLDEILALNGFLWTRNHKLQLYSAQLQLPSLFLHVQESLGCCLHPTLWYYPQAHLDKILTLNGILWTGTTSYDSNELNLSSLLSQSWTHRLVFLFYRIIRYPLQANLDEWT